MSDGLLRGLYIVPILAVLILIHEIGHFASARAVGVKVEEFGIGIPPRLKGWRRNGVIWSINWIPFGGFVRVLGEDGKSHDPGSMNTKSPWQRAFFLAAGSAMNFLLAILLIILVVGVQGVPASSGLYVGAVAPDSPAAAADLRVGDRLLEIAGVEVDPDTDIRGRSEDFAGRPMSVVVDRGASPVEILVTPRADPPANQGPIGIGVNELGEADILVDATDPGSPAEAAGLRPGDRIVAVTGRPAVNGLVATSELQRAAGTTVDLSVERDGSSQEVALALPPVEPTGSVLTPAGLEIEQEPRFNRVPAAQVIPRGLQESWRQTTGMVDQIRTLITDRDQWSNVAGPIGMGQATSEIIRESPLPLWVTLASIATVLSLNLGMLNLLPLPALDGGRLLFVLIEILRGGRRIAPEREGLVHFAGLVLLLGFMFVVAFFDVGRLLGGRSFLP